MEPQETTRLLVAARQGSATALDDLYRRCARKLLPLIRLRMGRSLRSNLESRDILQAVLLKSFQKLSQVQDPATLMAWLSRIAENEIRDQADFHHRQRREDARRAPIEAAEDLPAPVRQALSQAIESERSEQLERALEALPEAQREVIVLRKLEELTFPEIASRLGKSEDASRMMFARAMTALTLELKGERG
jgi:RNA polymerase sigma-70 factor (ECF subfamily)